MNNYNYLNEDDKCYGITGMVISLNVFENDTMLQGINLDSEEGEYISFTPDFYFHGNPRFSAKIAFHEMLNQYQMYTALVIGNIMCRYMVGNRKQLTGDNIRDMHGMVEDDGRDLCALEDDEIEMVFNKTYNYLSRLYTNRKVHDIARGLVAVIKKNRTMTGSEVLDELQYLRRR